MSDVEVLEDKLRHQNRSARREIECSQLWRGLWPVVRSARCDRVEDSVCAAYLQETSLSGERGSKLW